MDCASRTERSLRIVSQGFPNRVSCAGQLEGKQEVVVRLPENWVPGSLKATLSAFPSTVASIQEGVEGLLQEPGGCFERDVSAVWLNALILAQIENRGLADPAIIGRARESLSSSYGRLTKYETSSHGFSWFGSDPASPILTAYGLMAVGDAARVYGVDRPMIEQRPRG